MANGIIYETVTSLLAATEGTRGEGAIWLAGGYLYREASPAAEDQDVTTAGGAKLYVVPLPEGYVTPEQFGAAGDGESDDTAEVTAACQHVMGNTVSVWFRDSSVYLVTPCADERKFIIEIAMCDVAVFRGAGTLKVAASSGNYTGILGWVPGVTGPEYVTCDGVTFDHNGQKNIQAKMTAYTDRGRYTLSTYIYSNTRRAYKAVKVRNCTILNADSVVSMYFPHTPGNVHAEIIDCTWINARNGNGMDFDQSFINCTCESLIVTGCAFRGESWDLAPRTAIETHASDCLVSDNSIDKFQVGVSATGIHQTLGTTERQQVTGNTMSVNRNGIFIWSQSIAPANAMLGQSGIIVSDNQVWMNPTACVVPARAGYIGIGIYGGAKHIATERVLIESNHVIYPPDQEDNAILDQWQGETPQPDQLPILKPRDLKKEIKQKRISQRWGGIHAYLGPTPGALMSQFTIRGNLVKSCPTPGIFLECGKYRNLRIIDNELIDCASSQSRYVKLLNSYGMFVGVDLLSDCTIESNRIVWNARVPATDAIFVRNRSSSPLSYYRVKDNIFEWSGKPGVAALGVYSGTRVSFSGEVRNGAISLPVVATLGDRVHVLADVDRGPHWAEVCDASTLTWRRVVHGEATPTAGAWQAGDQVWKITPAAGTSPGWVCTASGTPGTWKQMANLEA